jgi:hypothetical protein
MANRMVNFLSPNFPHKFTKKDRQDLKMGYAVSMHLDVSYNLCSKLVSKHILFSKKIMVILVLPDHFWILTAFSGAGDFKSGTR